MPAIGRNTRVEVQKTIGAAIPITGIALLNPVVVTFTGGTSPVNGDVVVLADDLAGTVELAGQIARVANVSASPKTFELESIDGTAFSTFSGTSSFKIISAWSTLGIARSLNAGSPAINKIDTTTLLDSEKQFVPGQNDTPEISVDAISNPLAEAALLIEVAARAGTGLGFRVTMSDATKRLFRGYVNLPSESIPLGDLVTASFSIVQIRRRLAFAT